jgi:prepilin-type N-terminal cleavage/methylation domain-containing protein
MQPSCAHHDSRRSGFTLFELLIVLGVMLLIAGIVWPRMLSFYQTSTLKDCARQMNETISAARLAAIDNGIAYQFFYEPSGRHFLMIPSEDLPASANSSDAGETFTLPARAGQLPELYTITAGNSEEQGGINLTPDMLRDVPEDLDLSSVNWSMPIVFYPDGSASDMRIELEDDRQQYISITVRALTGTATLSPIQRRD